MQNMTGYEYVNQFWSMGGRFLTPWRESGHDRSMVNIVLRILALVSVALLGGLVYAVTANVLIAAGTMPAEAVEAGFGREMTAKAVFVWMACVPAALLSFLIQSPVRYVLFFLPLYAPSLFAAVFVLLA